MSDDSEHIHDYYSPENLYQQIIEGLEKQGKNPATATLDDLQPVDEFHIRGNTATQELIALSGFDSTQRILDVGCGIGGSTRRLASEVGCRVVGIDLSEEYVETARRLTTLLGMEDLVSFEVASALALPFGNDTFDGGWSIQMNMNVDDKLAWLRETRRVLRPGSRLVLYEVCAGEEGEPHFPVPWARDRSMSFLVLPETFRDIVVSAGFEVTTWRDQTDLARKAFDGVQPPSDDDELPALGVYMLVGRDVRTKAYNLSRSLREGRVTLIETVATKE